MNTSIGIYLGIQRESLQVCITLIAFLPIALALYSTLNLEQSKLHRKPVAIGRCKIKWLNEPAKKCSRKFQKELLICKHHHTPQQSTICGGQAQGQ